MVKKRVRDADATSDLPRRKSEASSLGSEEDLQTLPVTFEFFNFHPVDYESIKLLLRQLFDVDSHSLDLGAIADLIVKQDTIGSTVKDEEGGREEGGVFGFLSVLPLPAVKEGDGEGEQKDGLGNREKKGDREEEKRGKEALRKVIQWVKGRVGEGKIKDILSKQEQGQLPKDGIGLVLSERLINCPSELAPPMYDCLLDELEAALEDGEAYDFSHYLIISRGWVDVESQLDKEDSGPKGKKKKVGAGTGDANGNEGMQDFHDEDEVLRRCALEWREFGYEREGEGNGGGASDSRRAFREVGMVTRGCVFLIEGGRFGEVVGELRKNSGRNGLL